MAYQTSPGISVTELDLTTVVPSVASTTGAIAGVFGWGPVNTPVLVSSEVELVKRFGKPITGFNVETFFSAADFLGYGNSLYVTRANTGVTATATNGSAIYNAGIAAKYVGDAGNTLKVAVATSNNYSNSTTNVGQYVTSTPSAGTMHIVVIDEDGVFTGVANTVLEVYEDVSFTAGAKKVDGTNNYWADVVNRNSNYIAVGTITSMTGISTATAAVEASLANGTNGSDENTIAVGTITAAYDTFKNPEEIDISLVIGGVARGVANTEVANYIISNIVEARLDAILFVSPPKAAVVNSTTQLASVSTFANSVTSSSYVVLDSGYKYRYDRYNDTYVYTPLNGDIAGLCARTDELRDPWFSPAGYNRGGVKNVIKLAYNPGKADRDALYKLAVNPVITQPGQGTVLFGDKTGLKKPSAFDRINVRRLFIILEKAISRASKNTLFEFNDSFTRAQFKNLVEPFLRDIQGRRGIYDYRVVCDESNNTPEVIDSNKFVGDIYIKPARAINFIQLNFVAVRTGIEFNEIIGQR